MANIGVSVSTRGLNTKSKRIRRGIENATRKIIDTGLVILLKNANDRNFQFKTPRIRRTGMLERSYVFGIRKTRGSATIEPTVEYAERVARTNPFTERIRNQSESEILRVARKEFDSLIKKENNRI